MPSKKQAPSVFVRGLPYTVDETGLSELFSSVVPVRRAIIIRDPSTRVSKGFGFVHFAFADDAATAAASLNGREIEGRKLRVEVASEERGAEAARAKEKRAAKEGGGKGKEKEKAAAAGASAGAAAAAAPAAPKAGAKRARAEEPAAAADSGSKCDGAAEDGAAAVAAVRSKPQAKKQRAAPAPAPAPAPAAAKAAGGDDDSDSDSDSDGDADGGAAAGSGGAKSAGSGVPKKAVVTLPPPGVGSLHEKQHSLVVFGLPADFAPSRLWKRVRKLTGCTGIAFPLALFGNVGCTVAQLQFDTKVHRDRAVGKLDGHSLNGHALLARRGEEVPHHRDAFATCRLIVRNLRFTAVAADLRAAVAASAPAVLPALTHVHLPSKQPAAGAAADGGEEGATTGGAKPLNRGFGFLEFATRVDAQAAMTALNGAKVGGREVAVDWATSGAAAAEAAPAAAAAAAAADAEAPAADDAVAAKANGDDDSSSDASSDGGEEEAADGDAAEEAAAADAEEGSDDEEEEDDDEEEEDADEDAADSTAAPTKPATAAGSKGDGIEAGTTLFLRNLPYDAADDQLYTLMKAFGPLRYARCVMDPLSGACKGTGFVQYYAKESADRALEAANARDAHSAAYDKGTAGSDDPRAARKAELAAAVTAAAAEGGLKLNGRVVFAMRAVNKDEAGRLAGGDKEEAKARRFDKRHTYLSFEGNIKPGTPQAEAMPASDLAKRQAAAADKKKKLVSPLFFVSATRLSVRNLAKNVTDAQLKALSREAAQEGLAAGLVTRAEGDPQLMPEPGAPWPPKLKEVKAKVMREVVGEGGAGGRGAKGGAGSGRARMEADGVTPRSKGYGFLEFEHHALALAALRQLNNNPAYSAQFAAGGAVAKSKPAAEQPRLIVEFSIENIAEVKKHERRREMAKQKAALLAAEREASGAGKRGGKDAHGNQLRDGADAKADKKQEKKERQRAAREERKQQKAAAAADGTTAAAAPAPAAAAAAAPESRKRKRVEDAAAPADEGAADAGSDAGGDAPAAAAAATGGKHKMTFRERRDRIRQQKRERRERAVAKRAASEAAGGSGSSGAGGGDDSFGIAAALGGGKVPAPAAAAAAATGSKKGVRFAADVKAPAPAGAKKPAAAAAPAPVAAPAAAAATGGLSARQAKKARRAAAEEARQAREERLDPGLAAVLADADAEDGDGGSGNGRSRRGRKHGGDASAAAAGGKRAGGGSEADLHDRMVSEYRAKLFGAGGSSEGASGKGGAKATKKASASAPAAGADSGLSKWL